MLHLRLIFRVIQIFGKTRSSIDDVPEFSSQDMNAATWNIESLKHKVTFLLNMVSFVRVIFYFGFFPLIASVIAIWMISDRLDTGAMLAAIFYHRIPRSRHLFSWQNTILQFSFFPFIHTWIKSFFCRPTKRLRGRAPKIRAPSFEPIQWLDRATIWINLASWISEIYCWHARKLTKAIT